MIGKLVEIPADSNIFARFLVSQLTEIKFGYIGSVKYQTLNFALEIFVAAAAVVAAAVVAAVVVAAVVAAVVAVVVAASVGVVVAVAVAVAEIVAFVVVVVVELVDVVAGYLVVAAVVQDD